MAEATSQLQRIADLVQRAGTIGGKQRGMRIEAEDWNTLVDILLGVLQIDRLQEQSQAAQLEQRFALRDHEHLGEVNVAWLEPGLQTGIAGGNAVTTRQVLADMDRKLAAVQDQVGGLQAVLDAHQRQLDRMAVDEIGRAKLLRDFETRFESVANTRTAVQTLSTEVSGLRTTFDQVLELRKVLTDPTGAPIDVARVRDDVADLQAVRDSLKGVDGQPLTLREIETRIAEIADAVGVGNDGGLDKRLADQFADVESTLTARTQAQLTETRAAMAQENVALESRIAGLVQTTAADTRAAAAADLSAQLAALESRQTTALDQRSAALATTTSSGLAGVRDEISRRMAEVPEVARAAAVAAADAARVAVTADLESRLPAAAAAQVAAAEARLGTRLGSLEAGLSAIGQDVPRLVGDAVRAATATLDASVTQKIAADVSAAEGRLQSAVSAQVASAVATSLAGVDTRIAATVSAQMPAIDARVDQRVGAAMASLAGSIGPEVTRQITAVDVDGRIGRAVQAATVAMQSNVAAQLSDQQARLSTSIASTATVLRSEFSASLDASISKARVEIQSSLDDRLGSLDTVISREVTESVTSQLRLATRTMDERITKIESALALR